MKIPSFDVYDTVLTRIWFRPTDLFYAVGKILANRNIIKDDLIAWHNNRINAETISRTECIKEDICLDDIYNRIAKIYNWDNFQKIVARNIEIEVELLSIYPIEYSINKINKFRVQNTNIVFITDIYLPKEIVQKALRNIGVWREGDRLFVSSEIGFTKQTGNIYSYIINKLGIESSEINHFGDNPNSDIYNAKQKGIMAEHFKIPIPTRYENIMYNSNIESNIPKSLLPGISRTVRLSSALTNDRLQNLWNIGANIIAPVLFGFVLWVLEEAKKHNMNRLYFIARDGQILKQIAEIISDVWGFGIECRYLYGSKRAWVMPAITNPSDICIEKGIRELTGIVSVANLCNYFNIKPDSIKDTLLKYDFNKDSWKSVIKDKYKLKSLQQCFEEEFVLDSILRNAGENRKSTLGYLRQEGLFNDNSYAIVDSGWEGRLHYSLSKLIRMANINIEGGLTGYYFGVSSNKYDIYENDKRISWFYRYGELENKYIIDLSYVLVFETFLSADHGRTIKYTIDKNGKYIPVWDQTENTNALQWGLIELQKSVLSFCSLLTKHCSSDELTSGDILKVSKKLLMLFLLNPSRDEALVVSSFKQRVMKTDNIDYDLCLRMNIKHIIKALLFGKIKEFGGANWIEGSIAISNFRYARIYIYLYNIRSKVSIYLSNIKYKVRYVINK